MGRGGGAARRGGDVGLANGVSAVPCVLFNRPLSLSNVLIMM